MSKFEKVSIELKRAISRRGTRLIRQWMAGVEPLETVGQRRTGSARPGNNPSQNAVAGAIGKRARHRPRSFAGRDHEQARRRTGIDRRARQRGAKEPRRIDRFHRLAEDVMEIVAKPREGPNQ
jgi:hypothetical protein